MAYIKTLKDSNDNTIYPQSLTSAVVDIEGNNLETIHRQFITATALETEIEDVNIKFESSANKTTVLSEESTDIQYPSAKAVYDTTNLLDAALTQLDDSVSEHTGTLVNSENGIHGIKYQDNSLQVLNPTSYEWETVQTSGGNSSPITIVPDGTNFIDGEVISLTNGLYYAEGIISFNGVENPYFSNALFMVRNNPVASTLVPLTTLVVFEIINTPYIPSSGISLGSGSWKNALKEYYLQNMKMYKVSIALEDQTPYWDGDDASVEVIDLYTMLPAASATQAGVVKMSATGSALYITNDGSDAE